MAKSVPFIVEDIFAEVTEEVIKERNRQEDILKKEKKRQEEINRLNQPFFKRGPTTKSKGKKLKVSASKGARGLFQLI